MFRRLFIIPLLIQTLCACKLRLDKWALFVLV